MEARFFTRFSAVIFFAFALAFIADAHAGQTGVITISSGGIVSLASDNVTGFNGTDVDMPDGTGDWINSPISISSCPVGAEVTKIDGYFDFHHQYSETCIIELADQSNTAYERLWDFEYHSGYEVYESFYNKHAFDGQSPAQTWLLWGIDSYPGYDTGYIDEWMIEIHYSYQAYPAGYCLSAATFEDEYIDSVVLGEIEHTDSGFSSEGYGDFTAMSTMLSPGQSYTMTVSVVGYVGDRCGAWIDWNQDEDFDDPCEQVINHTVVEQGDLVFDTDIEVPGDAVLGSTRMRVRVVWDNEAIPCDQTPYGETQDYTIVIGQAHAPGDIVPPEGVGMEDIAAVCAEWLFEEIAADVSGVKGVPDGIVNFCDFAMAAQSWPEVSDLPDVFEHWLAGNALVADIAPGEGGDGVVNFADLSIVLADCEME